MVLIFQPKYKEIPLLRSNSITYNLYTTETNILIPTQQTRLRSSKNNMRYSCDTPIKEYSNTVFPLRTFCTSLGHTPTIFFSMSRYICNDISQWFAAIYSRVGRNSNSWYFDLSVVITVHLMFGNIAQHSTWCIIFVQYYVFFHNLKIYYVIIIKAATHYYIIQSANLVTARSCCSERFATYWIVCIKPEMSAWQL